VSSLLSSRSGDIGNHGSNQESINNITVTASDGTNITYLDERAEYLIGLYKTRDLTFPLFALAMRSLTNDEEMDGAAFYTPYSGYDTGGHTYAGYTYGNAVTTNFTGSADAMAAIDQIAMGQSPRNYQKRLANTNTLEDYDLIDALLSQLQLKDVVGTTKRI